MGFYLVPFGIDGEQLGIGFWETAKLSDFWLDTCKRQLTTRGPTFDASWSGNLKIIRTRLTSASGVAIATFFVRDHAAASLLFLSGQSPEAENDVRELFVESLRKSLKQWVPPDQNTFSALTSIGERPLMAVVAFPDPTVSDQEHEIVRELGLHLAGAFFTG